MSCWPMCGRRWLRGRGILRSAIPIFLNGPGHALPLVEAFHAEFPEVTYDVTIKVEHLLRHEAALAGAEADGVFVL